MQDKQLNLLITETKNGSDGAFEEIVVRFDPLVSAVCNKFKVSFEKYADYTEADLKQELTLALYRACVGYNTEQDKVTFGMYSKRCLENCAVSILRKLQSADKKEKKALEKIRREHTFETMFADYLGDGDKDSVMASLCEGLSSYEYTVFTRYIEGYSAAEIASELGKDEKSVNNAVFRSKEKVKKIYNSKKA